MYGVRPTYSTQVMFASLQSYEVLLHVIDLPSLNEQVDNTPVQKGVEIGRRFLFQSRGN